MRCCEAERLIQRNMKRICAGRTVFVIAHRLSTLQVCDRILVLDEGRLVEDGTHAALLAKGGVYARLCRGGEESRAGLPKLTPVLGGAAE